MANSKTTFRIKRVYDKPAQNDGFRVLVDRLWPRGVSKDGAQLDDWCKNIAPSPELRKWFDHDSAKFDEFAARYEDELASNVAVEDFVSSIQTRKVVTLLYGTKDTANNHAVVLQKFIEQNINNG